MSKDTAENVQKLIDESMKRKEKRENKDCLSKAQEYFKSNMAKIFLFIILVACALTIIYTVGYFCGHKDGVTPTEKALYYKDVLK